MESLEVEYYKKHIEERGYESSESDSESGLYSREIFPVSPSKIQCLDDKRTSGEGEDTPVFSDELIVPDIVKPDNIKSEPFVQYVKVEYVDESSSVEVECKTEWSEDLEGATEMRHPTDDASVDPSEAMPDSEQRPAMESGVHDGSLIVESGVHDGSLMVESEQRPAMESGVDDGSSMIESEQQGIVSGVDDGSSMIESEQQVGPISPTELDHQFEADDISAESRDWFQGHCLAEEPTSSEAEVKRSSAGPKERKAEEWTQPGTSLHVNRGQDQSRLIVRKDLRICDQASPRPPTSSSAAGIGNTDLSRSLFKINSLLNSTNFRIPTHLSSGNGNRATLVVRIASIRVEGLVLKVICSHCQKVLSSSIVSTADPAPPPRFCTNCLYLFGQHAAYTCGYCWLKYDMAAMRRDHYKGVLEMALRKRHLMLYKCSELGCSFVSPSKNCLYLHRVKSSHSNVLNNFLPDFKVRQKAVRMAELGRATACEDSSEPKDLFKQFKQYRYQCPHCGFKAVYINSLKVHFSFGHNMVTQGMDPLQFHKFQREELAA